MRGDADYVDSVTQAGGARAWTFVWFADRTNSKKAGSQ